MDEQNHWLYVIDVARRAARMVQETQDLTQLEDFDRVIDEDTNDDLSSSDSNKIDYASTSNSSSSIDLDSHELSFKTFDTNVDKSDDDTTSRSTIGLNLKAAMEIDPEDMHANMS